MESGIKDRKWTIDGVGKIERKVRNREMWVEGLGRNLSYKQNTRTPNKCGYSEGTLRL